ncbi:MAG: Ppx/GppA phosphatase family protein, partial [Ilumatobacteraceae bacterium]
MTTTTGPTTLAALDIGTNSFHLVVARILDNGYEVVTREKETVRLGHGGGDMKVLSADAMDRGISSLRRMQRIAAAHNAPVRAVATSAVREAGNADVFLNRARREAKVEIEVISGLEEARLIHLGVLQAVPAFDQRLILVDIGGGSTEVLVGERGETLTARSFKLGAVRLTDRFFPGGIVTTKALSDCRSYIRSILATFEREVEELGFDIAIASSGTAETIARMIHAARD